MKTQATRVAPATTTTTAPTAPSAPSNPFASLLSGGPATPSAPSNPFAALLGDGPAASSPFTMLLAQAERDLAAQHAAARRADAASKVVGRTKRRDADGDGVVCGCGSYGCTVGARDGVGMFYRTSRRRVPGT